MSLQAAEANNENQQIVDALGGIEMVLIKCHFCKQPQMELSDDSRATVRRRCKRCKRWNTFQVAPLTPRQPGRLQIKFVKGAGRD